VLVGLRLLNIIFHERPFSHPWIVTCGQIHRQADIEKLIGLILQLFIVKAPKNWWIKYRSYLK
jgi:hypothetical protein